MERESLLDDRPCEICDGTGCPCLRTRDWQSMEMGCECGCRSCGLKPPGRDKRLVPVMVRGGSAHAPSKFRVHGEYETFAEAAAVVHELRRDPSINWAYIPDEYAAMAE